MVLSNFKYQFVYQNSKNNNNIEAPIIDLSVPQRPYQFTGLKLTALIKYNLALC